MRLSEMFSKRVVTAERQELLASIARRMQEHNVGAVVIVENGRPVGIITDRDVALALGAQDLSPQTPVERVMSSNVRTISEESGVFTAAKYMRDLEVRRLPIVDERDRLVGIVTLDDLLHILGRELFNLAEGISREMAVK